MTTSFEVARPALDYLLSEGLLTRAEYEKAVTLPGWAQDLALRTPGQILAWLISSDQLSIQELFQRKKAESDHLAETLSEAQWLSGSTERIDSLPAQLVFGLRLVEAKAEEGVDEPALRTLLTLGLIDQDLYDKARPNLPEPRTAFAVPSSAAASLAFLINALGVLSVAELKSLKSRAYSKPDIASAAWRKAIVDEAIARLELAKERTSTALKNASASAQQVRVSFRADT